MRSKYEFKCTARKKEDKKGELIGKVNNSILLLSTTYYQSPVTMHK